MGTEPTEERQRNLALVQGGLESWISGDHEATIATFTEDVEVFVPNELGNAGTFHGIDQFRKWFREWDDAWSEFVMKIESIEAAGDHHVIAMIRSRGIGTGSGIEVENKLGWVIGVRDGRMDFLALQPDRECALALVAGREAK
jgi:ketosteroid isomerase-like protein